MGKEDHEKDKSNGHHTIHGEEDQREPTGSLATNLVLTSLFRIEIKNYISFLALHSHSIIKLCMYL